ncbi:hypothetical protein F8S09_06835 [Deinococcus sp. SDU3-2]|uniref:DUF4352 domain-containing protein n=1 Tax=Deinococcus terrestris TaxID=2651870 RepID=A0A7X1NVX4_9DEIO|nr:hypothetical protein [Deinococcus terrestris]MPY66411.1 hypothetical protein [Deinococcus terrestris]
MNQTATRRFLPLLAALTLAGAAHATVPTRAVQGTTQLDGVAAKFGETFTLGKQSPLNFTLLKAEYSVGRVVIGNTVYFPKAAEKLLILHYTVHNPQKAEVRYYWPEVRFTAVDAQDRNSPSVQAVARDGTGESLEVRLKPAQKINVMTVIRVPAAGVVPKLMVQREAALLRYDLRGQVTPLARGIADPADTSGATPLTQVPTAPNTFSPLERFDVRLDEVKFTGEALGGKAPPTGQRYLSAVFTIRNMEPGGGRYLWSDFKPVLKDADGERMEYNQTMLKASRDEKAGGTLTAGEEARVRFFFALPANVNAQSLMLTDGSGRAYVYDLSGVR